LIRDDERQVMSGIPGLSDIPFVGRLFAHNQRESKETDIILTLTPHIIRVLQLREEDLRAFRVGRDGAGIAADPDLPALPQPPQQTPAPQQQPAQPAPGPIFAPPVQPPPNNQDGK
jgi:general secretion pathway protein D